MSLEWLQEIEVLVQEVGAISGQPLPLSQKKAKELLSALLNSRDALEHIQDQIQWTLQLAEQGILPVDAVNHLRAMVWNPGNPFVRALQFDPTKEYVVKNYRCFDCKRIFPTEQVKHTDGSLICPECGHVNQAGQEFEPIREVTT